MTVFDSHWKNLFAKLMLHTAKERHQNQLHSSIKITIFVICGSFDDNAEDKSPISMNNKRLLPILGNPDLSI